MDVTVLHVMPTLMERQLDPAAGYLLQRAVEQRGIKVITKANTQAITGNGKVGQVELADGTIIPATLVVMAVGIRPNSALAKQAGIAESEMLRTFNCGIGLVAVADEKHAGHVIDAFQEAGDHAVRIGRLIRGGGEAKVVYRGALKL